MHLLFRIVNYCWKRTTATMCIVEKKTSYKYKKWSPETLSIYSYVEPELPKGLVLSLYLPNSKIESLETVHMAWVPMALIVKLQAFQLNGPSIFLHYEPQTKSNSVFLKTWVWLHQQLQFVSYQNGDISVRKQ